LELGNVVNQDWGAITPSVIRQPQLSIFTTQVKNLRVCCSRTIMVYYLDAVWYGQLSTEVMRSGHPRPVNWQLVW
ncbi:hypothetical protein PN473_03810, partial [Dolichospermum circinale CS-545/17]|nr:hypothetical protein [Dolichospermum circinale CS-545/17]